MQQLGPAFRYDLDVVGISYQDSPLSFYITVEDWVYAVIATTMFIVDYMCESVGVAGIYDTCRWILSYCKDSKELQVGVSSAFQLAGTPGVIAYFEGL